MRYRTAVLILISSGLVAQTARVPFVGCPQDGQAGPVKAPRVTNEVVRVDAPASRRLAFYATADSFGVLAPRGWHCFGNYGSGGGELFVAPHPINAAEFTGPAIELEAIEGAGSGTVLAAEVWARAFPAQWPIVKALINNRDLPAKDYTFGPYPADKLLVQTARLVRFQTPPHSEGLGTMGHFKADHNPIDSVAILEGQDPDLLMLRVRLLPDQRDLAPIIIHDLLVRQRRDAR